MKDDVVPHLVTFSFMLPHDHRRGARYRHLVTAGSTELERAVLSER